MKRTGVIFSLGLNEQRWEATDPDVKAQLLEQHRVDMAVTFPGVRFCVVPYGATAAFEFDDDDVPLLDRKLPVSESATTS